MKFLLIKNLKIMTNKMFKSFPAVISLLFLIPLLCNAQVKKIPIDESFIWKEKTNNTETFEFEVKKGTKNLEMKFEGYINEGSLKLTIKNSEGYKASGFSLVCTHSKKSNSESNSGSNARERERSKERENARSSHHSSSANSISNSSSSSSSASNSSSSTSKEVSVSVSIDEDTEKIGNSRHEKSYSKTESNEEGARGVMTKNIESPKPGIWTVKINLEDVSGELSAKINLN